MLAVIKILILLRLKLIILNIQESLENLIIQCIKLKQVMC